MYRVERSAELDGPHWFIEADDEEDAVRIMARRLGCKSKDLECTGVQPEYVPPKKARGRK